jgi:hypothetical protein
MRFGGLVIGFKRSRGDPPRRGLDQHVLPPHLRHHLLGDAVLLDGQLGQSICLGIALEVLVGEKTTIPQSDNSYVRLRFMRWHPYHLFGCSVPQSDVHHRIDTRMRAAIRGRPSPTPMNGIDARLAVSPIIAPKLCTGRRLGEGPCLCSRNIINPSGRHTVSRSNHFASRVYNDERPTITRQELRWAV